MSVGDRIRFFRKKRGLTQKLLGTLSGISSVSAEVRINQYENNVRSPKEEIKKKMADTLGISPLAINVPDIDSQLGLMHTLIALEDMYGLKPAKIDGEACLHVDLYHGNEAITLYRFLCSWAEQAELLENGEITQEEYDNWRYNYPKFDKKSGYRKTLSFD